MSKVMLTLKLDSSHATLEHVRDKLNLGPHDLDEDFGVVNIDPQQHLYAIRVEESAASTLDAPGVSGPFADPTIEQAD